MNRHGTLRKQRVFCVESTSTTRTVASFADDRKALEAVLAGTTGERLDSVEAGTELVAVGSVEREGEPAKAVLRRCAVPGVDQSYLVITLHDLLCNFDSTEGVL